MKCIACLGDSNTYGYDPCSMLGGRYSSAFRWPDLLAKKGIRVLNLGQNGLGVTRESVHSAMVQELRSLAPVDLVTVMLGTNDLLLGHSVEETAASMKKLLSLILQENAADKILLIAPVRLSEGAWVSDPMMNRFSGELAESYCRLAELLNISFADAGKWDIPLTYDGVHFTEEGHVRFAEALAGLLPQ